MAYRRFNKNFHRSYTPRGTAGGTKLSFLGIGDDLEKEAKKQGVDFSEEEIKIESKVWIVKVPNFNLEDEEKISEAKKGLTEDQIEIFDRLRKFVTEPILKKNDKLKQKYFTLEGYAGTGKTYLLSRFLSIITSPIAVSAPTNKAVKVLSDNRYLNNGKAEVVYNTIHKFLALKLVWVAPKGKYDMPKQMLSRNTFAAPTINDYPLLIIDEASMLNQELFNLVHTEVDEHIKVIFVGDPAQIPPVNEIDSIPLLSKAREEYNMEYGTLKKIMRQEEGNDILQLASLIRDKRFHDVDGIASLRKSLADSKNVLLYNYTEYPNFIMKIHSTFSSNEFTLSPNHAKVIAWTNQTVNDYNKLIRVKLFNRENLNKIEVGEKLIADSAIFRDDKTILFNTSDEFEVVGFIEDRLPVYFPGKPAQGSFEFADLGDQIWIDYYYTTVVTGKGTDISTTNVIKIVHEKSEDIYQSALKKMVAIARKTNIWVSYYDLLEKFAKVKYNYAITAHKSQGSTYNNVFLIEDDITPNPRHVERNRILYTACTRPKDTLHILSSKNPIKKIKENNNAT